MKKINKKFDEKCIKIRNRIQRLKNEEEECLKKRLNFIKKQKQGKLIREEKRKIKNEVKKYQEERIKALNSKKEIIQNQRIKDNLYRENKKNESLSQKKMNYQSSLNEKYVMKIIKEQLNTLEMNKNAYSHAKIKQEYNEYETSKVKKNLDKENQNQKMHEHHIKELRRFEDKIENTYNQLEKLEKEAIDRLKKTKYMNLRLFSEDKYRSNYSEIKRNKIIHNKNLNRSMENIKLKDFNLKKNIEFEEKNANKTILVDKAGSTIQSEKKRKMKLKNINNLQKGLSMSTLPKTNKEKNSKKISLKLKNQTFIKKDVKNKDNKKSKTDSVKNSKK